MPKLSLRRSVNLLLFNINEYMQNKLIITNITGLNDDHSDFGVQRLIFEISKIKNAGIVHCAVLIYFPRNSFVFGKLKL